MKWRLWTTIEEFHGRMAMTIQRPPSGWEFERVTEHPGAMLREEFMEPLGLSTETLAERLHVPVRELEALVREEIPLTAEMALRLGRFFSVSAEMWMGFQQQHDLTKTERSMRKQIEAEVFPRELSTAA